jgi:hypothetical protein
MHDKASTTAILIFSRTASREADVKTFDPSLGKSGNKLVARYLIRQTVKTARKTGLPVFLCYDNAAADLSFGQRFADAVEGIFQKGYSKLITIGNDSPELTTKVLTEAAHQLEQNNMVVGPAVDGGIYLLGLGQNQYNRAAFIDLPWQTAQLQHAFPQCFSAENATLVWLDELSDIDNSRDFKALLRRLSVFSGLLIQLLRLLAGRSHDYPLNPPSPLSFFYFLDIAPFRGPPLPCQCT